MTVRMTKFAFHHLDLSWLYNMKYQMAGDTNRCGDGVIEMLDISWQFSANFSTDILHLGDIKNIVESTSL